MAKSKKPRKKYARRYSEAQYKEIKRMQARVAALDNDNLYRAQIIGQLAVNRLGEGKATSDDAETILSTFMLAYKLAVKCGYNPELEPVLRDGAYEASRQIAMQHKGMTVAPANTASLTEAFMVAHDVVEYAFEEDKENLVGAWTSMRTNDVDVITNNLRALLGRHYDQVQKWIVEGEWFKEQRL